MDLQSFGKVLIGVGIAIAALGALVWIGGRLGLGSLPGDVRIERDSWGCYVPIASSIVLSLALTLLLNLVLRLLRK